MAQNAWKVGDTVRLKSGGPVMTISTIDGNKHWCKWFAGPKFESDQFPADALVAVQLTDD